MIKILIVNTFDIYGGAARAAYRLHRSLLDIGVDSYMLVQSKSSNEYKIISSGGLLRKNINRIRPRLDSVPLRKYKERTKTLFSPSWVGFSDIVEQIDSIQPDIVHLHWICGGMMRIEDISKIRYPIVWSLHDNWAFTGGCHIKWDCDRYMHGCGNCPRLGSHKDVDLSSRIYGRKERTFSKIDNLTVVGVSRWVENLSQNSSLLGSRTHINIPNPIDTNIFKVFKKEHAQELWNLPKDKKLIMFGAMNRDDINKGFDKLVDTLLMLDRDDIELVIYGSSRPKEPIDLGFKMHYLGRLHDDISLVTLYSAVDVVVVPSLQENLSNTIMESLACATPVVAFDIGGNGDLVDHLKSGYLAKPFDSSDLRDGIEWVLESKDYDQICNFARDKVLEEFDSKIVANRYMRLYEDILNDR
jgi:glycosyltransferase involved in cell wall biosynthesis